MIMIKDTPEHYKRVKNAQALIMLAVLASEMEKEMKPLDWDIQKMVNDNFFDLI